jgi:hypothetical protein
VEHSNNRSSLSRFLFRAALSMLVLCSVPGVFAETPLSSDLFESIIEKYDVRSAEQLLQHLPRESLSHYVILHKSGSIQWASQKAPRVVVFDSRARFIFSFNGDPSFNGYNTFDIFEFNPVDSRYYPREITFELDGSKRARYDREPGWRCTICHFNNTDNVTPRFDAYTGGIYPKVFGTLADTMSPLEKAKFEAFVDGPAKTGRYQYLPKLTMPDDGTWPEFKPNEILGTITIRNWLESIVKRVSSVARIKPFRYALLASVECARSAAGQVVDWDSNIENYLPENIRKIFSDDLSSVKSMLEKDRESVYQSRVSSRHDSFSDVEENEIKETIPKSSEELSASFLYLAKNLFKGSDFPSNYAFQIEKSLRQAGGVDDGLGGMLNAGESFYKRLLDETADREIYAIHADAENTKASLYSPFAIPQTDRKFVCGQLKRKSLDAFSALDR